MRLSYHSINYLYFKSVFIQGEYWRRTRPFVICTARHVVFSRQQTKRIAWALVGSILLYPLFTYLATPIAHTTVNGEWVVVCTLQGEKSVFVETGRQAESPSDACPALKLLQLTSSSKTAEPVTLPSRVVTYTLAQADVPGYLYYTPHFSVFPSRAPPLG